MHNCINACLHCPLLQAWFFNSALHYCSFLTDNLQENLSRQRRQFFIKCMM